MRGIVRNPPAPRRVVDPRLAANKLVDAICIRPVRFDSNRIESFFRDQALGNLRAQSVELVGAVRGFADQNKSSVADRLEQGIEVCRFTCESMS